MNEVALFNQMCESKCTVWIRAHIDHSNKDDCLIWPFARKGCGYAAVGKAKILIHRLMCEFRNGPPPTAQHYATHSCGRGQDGCVNPCHIRWKTPSENQFERYQHHGLKPSRKLTPQQAAEIRGLKGIKSADEIAASYGIGAPNVYLIQAGRTWNAKPRRAFTQSEVELIRSTPWQEKPAKQFAREFGVHHSVIERIRAGTTYRYFNTETPGSEVPQAESASQPLVKTVQQGTPKV